MKKIRLMIIENSRVLREGLIAMLDGQKDIEIIAAVGGGRNLLEKVKKDIPDIILLDLGSGDFDNLSFIKAVKNDIPISKIIVMGFKSANSKINKFIKAGASGFILKDVPDDKFLNVIRLEAHDIKNS